MSNINGGFVSSYSSSSSSSSSSSPSLPTIPNFHQHNNNKSIAELSPPKSSTNINIEEYHHIQQTGQLQQKTMIPSVTKLKSQSDLMDISYSASLPTPTLINPTTTNNNNNVNNTSKIHPNSLPSLNSIDWNYNNNNNINNGQQQQQQLLNSNNSSITNSPTNHHGSMKQMTSSMVLVTEGSGAGAGAPSSPENEHSAMEFKSFDRKVASAIDSFGKFESLQKQYESQMGQIMSQMEREQKQRAQIEDTCTTLQNENLKLRQDHKSINKKLKELEKSNEYLMMMLQQKINTPILQQTTSPPPPPSSLVQQQQPPPQLTFTPPSNSFSPIPNNNNNNIIQKSPSPSNISGPHPLNDKSILLLKKKKKGDEELVAETLGSFVELTASRKPMLKRSNSEDSFMHSIPYHLNGGVPGHPATSLNSNNNNVIPTTADGSSSLPMSGDYPFAQFGSLGHIQEEQSKLKKRRSEFGNKDDPKKKSLSSLPLLTINNTNNNLHNSYHQQHQLQQQKSFNLLNNIKIEQDQQQQGNSLKSSATILRKQQQQKLHIPDLETDVDTSDEIGDFSQNNTPMKSSGGIIRNSGSIPSENDDDPRNGSSSPIEAPMSDANLFKSIAGTDDTPHEATLNEIHRLQLQQHEVLEKMALAQKQLLIEHHQILTGHIAPTPLNTARIEETYATLQVEQKKLHGQIDSEVTALNQMYSQTILEPNQLCKLDILNQELEIQMKQLQIYQLELSRINSPGGGPEQTSASMSSSHTTALVITKQPFPMVISKFKQLQEDHLTVQLLTGSNSDIVWFSPIRAELTFHAKALTGPGGSGGSGSGSGASGSGTGKNSGANSQNVVQNNHLKKHIEKDTQVLDMSKGTAKFPIKFLTGTRKGCVKLHFQLQARTTDGHTFNIPSGSSQPFIVITNDCQWEGSEGTLLKKESFNEKFEITWPNFVNILQKHFLKATKQSPIQPTRPLSNYDFLYLNATFFGSRLIVHHKEFDHFWSWFGKSLQTLRYKRHISTLWQNGLIFMFLKRETVNNILKGQEPGTFVILFSESFAGQLEISYVSLDKQQESPLSLSSSLSNSSSAIPPPPSLASATTSTTDINGGSGIDQSSQSSATKIKHYLVQPNDTSGSKRTLPDFLNECPQFTHILQLNVPSLTGTSGTAVPQFKKEPKNQILEPYYSKRQNPQSYLGNGYDPLN